MGYCAGNDGPGYMKDDGGRGMGRGPGGGGMARGRGGGFRGRGGGRGFGRGRGYEDSPAELEGSELSVLREDIARLTRLVESAHARIQDLEIDKK